MSLTTLYVWRNVTRAYLPLESFLSTQDAADECIVCVDPTGTDQTVELAYAISESFSKVRVVEHVWKRQSVMGSAIGEASNFGLKFCGTDLVLNVQADEVFYPELTDWLRDNKGDLNKSVCNIWQFSFLHTRYNAQQKQANAGYQIAVKMARSYSFLRFAPDAWRLEMDSPKLCHVEQSDKYPIVHLHHFFRSGVVEQLVNNTRLYGDDNSFEELDRISGDRTFLADPLWGSAVSPFQLPELVLPHLGKDSYHVRWELLA